MSDLAIPSDAYGGETAPDIVRRKFLTAATGTLGAVGLAFAAAPFIESWMPSERARALGGPVDVDISKIDAGSMIIVLWRNQPTFILHRTAAQLSALEDPSHLSNLRDPNSAEMQQPDYAKNWHRSVTPEYLVVVGICTHLGCSPKLDPASDASLGPSWRGGYLCPCHGSKYDFAARVFKGVPAPYNLPVPPHRFFGASMVRIGENPPGSNFSFDSILKA
ncbi:MAG TPA: ubiquinol-cytochrome c reductase iron-sulfur subunit [Steroidobacteraceae bacterium]|jgi:ubiquinol-cytochrome c reductase iron-sulfur subunit|nr:ubiquinol-cytochrome c reductase iron-sulfur subunit [Steroidobacteraceae bacterium]